MTMYKVTRDDGSACHGGTGVWHLPKGKRPGKWMPDVPVDPCRSGYHLCTVDHLTGWMMGEGCTVWVAEGRGDGVDHDDKVVFRSARLLRPVLVGSQQLLLASDFAAHVAHLSGDRRVYAAIQATRDYANGAIDRSARDAARDAAWHPAWDPASAAARDAARDAAWHPAWAAASAAAMAAAWAAASDAARDAAWAAENKWQTNHVAAVINGDTEPGHVTPSDPAITNEGNE